MSDREGVNMTGYMLHVQRYLRSGNTLADLARDYAIRVYEHPTKALVGLKYCQIDSPRTHPIVRECRGIVLEKDTWRIVAKGFSRFFNVGELEEEFQTFEWDDVRIQAKEDGSLILLYWYDGAWHVNTSGSFGLGQVDNWGNTWRSLFWDTAPFTIQDVDRLADELNAGEPELSRNWTLVFEMCTPYNKIVRTYRPTVFLLSAFNHAYQDLSPPGELDHDFVDEIALALNVERPNTYEFSSKDEVKKFLIEMEDKDATFEGVVMRDNKGLRYKWKTTTYTALHHMKDNGNVLHPKRLVPIVLANEQFEIKAIMPECTSALDEVADTVALALGDLETLWLQAKDLPEQKSYALMVKDSPFSAILFNMRRYKPSGDIEDLREIWRESADLIVRRLFDGVTFKFDVIHIVDETKRVEKELEEVETKVDSLEDELHKVNNEYYKLRRRKDQLKKAAEEHGQN